MSEVKKEIPLYLGVFLISLASLLFEVSLIRVFSIAKWYHFAFMVISIALLGFGASGSFLALLKKRKYQLLIFFSALFSIGIPISFFITNHIPFDPYTFLWDKQQIINILIHYIILGLPFFFVGLCIAILFSEFPKKIGTLYASNLLGSGFGCVLALLLSSFFPIPSVIMISALFGLLGVLCFTLKKDYESGIAITRSTFFCIGGICILVFLLLSPWKINSSPYKSLNFLLTYPNSEILLTQWNEFSKVDLIKSSGIRYAPGLSYTYKKPIPFQLGITIDDNSLSPIVNTNHSEFVSFLPSALPYFLQKGQNVLLIEPMGGLDVLLASNKSVVVIERNPLIVDIVRKWSDVYERASAEIGDVRSFVRRTKEKFDIIQLPLSKNVRSSVIYGFGENYIYTTEAFEEFYTSLSDNGFLTVTNWLDFPPRESLRLVSLGINVLERQGVKRPENHFVLIRTLTTSTFILKKSEFTKEEIEKVEKFCEERGFDIIYAPGVSISKINRYNKFDKEYYYEGVIGILRNRSKFYSEYLFDVSPVYDNNPFFFNFFSLEKFSSLYESMGKKWEPFFEGGFISVVVFFQALFLSVVFILLPRYFAHQKPHTYSLLLYFFLLGIGYMLIELSLIQKFILFLGEPVYAISVIIFSHLFFSGIGSLFSNKLKITSIPAFVVSFLAIFYLLFLPYALHIFLENELLIKYIISIFLVAPIAFIMGMPFPIGLRLVGEKNLIPWAWCFNGCASVIGAVLPFILAPFFGFSGVLGLAGFVYLLAGVLFNAHE